MRAADEAQPDNRLPGEQRLPGEPAGETRQGHDRRGTWDVGLGLGVLRPPDKLSPLLCPSLAFGFATEEQNFFFLVGLVVGSSSPAPFLLVETALKTLESPARRSHLHSDFRSELGHLNVTQRSALQSIPSPPPFFALPAAVDFSESFVSATTNSSSSTSIFSNVGHVRAQHRRLLP